jgi:electron transfer flavoprotein alpha subunit/Pyruvate/2-oxoacid:ferredoxin oxidoreductase delta subunit
LETDPVAKRGIRIIEDTCKGCKLCVKGCPFGAICMVDGKAVIDYETCTLCGSCVSICKFDAIEMTGETVGPRAAEGDVWVFCECETDRDELAPVSLELIGLARTLADALGVRACGVLLGQGLSHCIQQAGEAGAERLYVAEDPALGRFDDVIYTKVLADLVRQHDPEILLGGATAVGRALLPRLAVDLHTGLTADCTELDIDPETGLLRQTRPAFGGNILATITCEHHRPQMATVRPAVLPLPEPCAGRRAEIVQAPIENLPAASLEWLSFIPRAAGGVDLREAEIIVSAGYGTGGPEGVKLVAQLAEALGGVLGSSRPAVDAGWVPYAHQVGQTGSTVQPKLYIACGISGAIQHVVGMQNAETVVAINRDPEAPILNYADYALVGDLFDIIPAILEQLTP